MGSVLLGLSQQERELLERLARSLCVSPESLALRLVRQGLRRWEIAEQQAKYRGLRFPPGQDGGSG